MLPQKLPYELMLTKWASELNPVLANDLIQGILLKGTKLSIGSNVINHLLGRTMVGWYVVDQDAAASIYRSAPLNDQTLTLTSNAVTTVNLWVF